MDESLHKDRPFALADSACRVRGREVESAIFGVKAARAEIASRDGKSQSALVIYLMNTMV